MPKSLVIVESPAKARTIAGFLGKGFIVESSIGHIRDLPRRAGDVPASHKQHSWARLGVDVENGFKPLYVVDPDKKSHIKHLKNLLGQVDELLLATDEDREGESIAWHLLEVLKPKVPVKRMAFHEITKKAILNAIANPRDVDRRLVEAQESRRILDRLYGYEVSPVLWKKVMPRLSAGRVQSVATRIVVEREQERIKFVPASYWDIDAELTDQDGAVVPALLTHLDGQRIASGKDFGADGKLKKKELLALNEARAKALAAALDGAKFSVQSVERKPYRRSPAAPFMTSTLQQEASRKLRFSASRAMRAAQALYEGGFITYMRTDSTTLSGSAIAASRAVISELYGKEYLPGKPRTYKNRVKNAQEAHEAIRPAGDEFQHPSAVARQVDGDQAKLYELVWKRTVASQMEDAQGESVKVEIDASAKGERCRFAATGNVITFPGFFRAYVEGSDDPESELEQRERHLPQLAEKQELNPQRFEPKGHETQPPARYTEASLVRRMEELGVGRPSTYASVISTILNRGYVWKKGTALVPSFTAFSVNGLLEKHFGALVDYAFTARMEDELDAIANGDEKMEPWLSRFYFGAANDNAEATGLAMGLRSLVADRLDEIDARSINSLPMGKDSQGREVVIRVGRYGPYLQREDETASIPDDMPPDELTMDKAEELLAAPSGDRELGTDPETGLPVYVRTGRFGAYVQLGEAGGKEKPKTGSLLSSMSAESATLDDALKMLSLPRTVGVDPADGKVITAQIGRYGPYLTKEKDSRTLEKEQDVFDITLEGALKLLAEPKRRGRRADKPPLKELGEDDVSGQSIVLKEGRFGLYVTDGETNASLRKGDAPEELTLERARELLQIRRDRGPSKKVRRKKAAKKKSASKKAPASTASGKKASKKGGSKKKASASVAPKSVAPGKAASKKQPANAAKAASSRASRPVPAKKAQKKSSRKGASKKKASKAAPKKTSKKKASKKHS